METIFHQIAQKPGKPLLFGRIEGGPLVFGLPGNPASTLVCYVIFFKAWLDRSQKYATTSSDARLTRDVQFSPWLVYHLLVTLETVDGVLLATPCSGGNSGDMISLQGANAVLSLPPDKEVFRKGEAYPLTMLSPLR
jgi:molybdopterin molybdotransferase